MDRGMLKIEDVLAQQTDATLAEAVVEISNWRRSGYLVTAGALREVCVQCGAEYELDQIESRLLMFVALRWANSVETSKSR